MLVNFDHQSPTGQTMKDDKLGRYLPELLNAHIIIQF